MLKYAKVLKVFNGLIKLSVEMDSLSVLVRAQEKQGISSRVLVDVLVGPKNGYALGIYNI